MIGAAQLALRHAAHHWSRTLILTLCIAAACTLPLAARVLSTRFETQLRSRAESTPLIAGQKGSRFDLVMMALYFRHTELPTATMADWQSLNDMNCGEVIPLNLRFTARGIPIIAAPPEYLEFRQMSCTSGAMPSGLGEVVLGSRAARSLGLTAGDVLFSDQRELYDISKPPALKMHVSGILAASQGPEDDAVFVDIRTAWILEGISHGHADASAAIPEALVLERQKSNIVVSESLVDHNEVTAANRATFHVHGDARTMPVSAMLVLPHSAKDASIIKARLNTTSPLQIVLPLDVVNEVLSQVVRVRQLIDALAAVIAIVTSALIALITALSIRVRMREIQTLGRIGASRGFICALFGCEIAAVAVAGASLAIFSTLVIAILPLDLFKLL